MHQPNYLPYLGFRHKMLPIDVFVLYDTAQFSKNDFHNRNRNKTPRGPLWPTVSVVRAGLRPIREVEPDGARRWATRHWKALEANTGRAPYFDAYAAALRFLDNRVSQHHLLMNQAAIDIIRTSCTSTRRRRAPPS